MPRKAAEPSVADQQAAPGGTAAVDRALSLLCAFRAGDGPVGLTELAERTGLHKSTALRLLASLVHAGMLRRAPDGRYALGPEVARLHAVHAASFSLEAVVVPVLRTLVARTRESAAFHVRQGDQRLCLYRVDSPQPVRDHLRAGDLLPLDRGAGGRVLKAWGAEPGQRGSRGVLYDDVRQQGVIGLQDDRAEGVSGISAPVFQAGGVLAGALTLSMPSHRYVPAHRATVREAAAALTAALGGEFPWATTPAAPWG
jgi:DNA-binding IclR family transcriptional regulator